MRLRNLLLPALVSAGLLATSGASAGDDKKSGATGSTKKDSTAKVGKLTEAQAIGVLLTSNANEVYMGQMAAARTDSAEVRQYANRLVDAHLSANRDLLNIVERNNIDVAESDLRGKEFSAVEKEVGELWGKSAGREFDQAFLTKAIEDHANDLKVIDEQILPNVTDSNLKQTVTSMRSTVASHLEEACRVGQGMDVTSQDCPQQERGTE